MSAKAIRNYFLAGGLFFIISTALVNIGIIALDDYTDIIANIVPAGVKTPSELIVDAGIRSPIPSLMLSSLAKMGKALGLSTPAWQLRFVLLLLGLFSYLTQIYCVVKIFRLFCSPFSLQERIGVFLFSFYFLAPLFMTRPMIESLAMPYLTLSAYLACVYFVKGQRWTLVASLVMVTMASLFRFQAGVCVAALVATVCITRRWRDLFLLALGGVVLFFATGFLDLWMRGSFHTSLRAYMDYNVANSSSYGVQPFYNFILLFFAMSFPPVLLVRYNNFGWRRAFKPLLPLLLYFLAFLVAHSAVPHKEERFILPSLGLFFILATPLATYVFEHHFRKRLVFFFAVNALLLVLTSYNIAQNNVVGLAKFLEHHPRIKSVHGVGSTLVLTPQAFVSRSIEFCGVGPKDLAPNVLSCDHAIAVRKDLIKDAPELTVNFVKVGEFRPGVLEAILVRLNPRQNARRDTIQLFAPKGCS